MTTSAANIAAPILMYHRIGTPRSESIVSGQYVPQTLFEKQLRFLMRRGYQPMSLGEFVKALNEPRAQRKPLAITFDDGYESFYTGALPILKKLGITATVFVVAGQVGGTNAWDEAKGDVTERIMTADQIVDASQQGMEIGSHTMNHVDLLAHDQATIVMEIAESKRKLGSLIGGDVDWFSYPFGCESDEIRNIVRDSGYVGACGTRRLLNTANTDHFSLCRVNIRASTSVLWLFYKLARAKRDSA